MSFKAGRVDDLINFLKTKCNSNDEVEFIVDSKFLEDCIIVKRNDKILIYANQNIYDVMLLNGGSYG